MIGADARRTEKITKLERELASGRPKGMHKTTYDARVEKLRELREMFGSERSPASSAYTRTVTAWWQSKGFAVMMDGRKVHEEPGAEDT